MKKKSVSGMLPLLIMVFFLISAVSAVSLPDSLVGQKVFVRYNLVFSGQTPKVYADNIVFIENQENCSSTIWEYVIGKSTEVVILDQEDQGEFLRLTIAPGLHGDLDILLEKHDILIAKSGNGDFEPSFNRVFSFNEVDDTPVETCNPKTERELIEILGFPIYRCQEDGFTIFYYNLGFIGWRVNGFHDIWFKMKDGKVLENFGNI